MNKIAAIVRRGTFLALLLIVVLNSCSKEEPKEEPKGQLATISEPAISEITESRAKVTASIESNGESYIRAKGFVWSTTPNPTLLNSNTNEGGGDNKFSSTIEGLSHNITYYVKAYATNEKGTSYSKEVSFNTGYHLDGSYQIYQTNQKGSYPNEIVILGDGYTIDEYAYGGKFDLDANKGIEALFSVEPYRSYRDYFSVYKLAAHSQERGASIQDPPMSKKTAFNTTFTTSTHLTTDTEKVFQTVSTIPGIAERIDVTLIILMVNHDKYGGYCYSQIDGPWDTRVIAICPVSTSIKVGANFTNFTNLVIHEAGGHGFGRLADEYVTAGGHGKHITQSYIDRYQNGIQYGFRPNIDLTGDKSKVKWRHFIGREGYEEVNVYEGAFVYSYGVWRPELHSVMINNTPYFNAPSREHIVKRILRRAAGVRIVDYKDGVPTPIVGDPFDFEEFVANDKVKSPTS